MKKILFYILLLVLSACSSPKPNFYRPIVLQEMQTSYPDVKGTILVSNVLMPAMMTKPQIITLKANEYEVKIDEYNRWAASPDRLIQNTINQNLSILLPHAVIENQTTLRKDYKYAVIIEINEMNARLNDMASLKVSYFIKNVQNKIIKQGNFEKNTELKNNYEGYILGISSLLANLSENIAHDLAILK